MANQLGDAEFEKSSRDSAMSISAPRTISRDLSRYNLAKIVLYGYMILIFLAFISPFAVYKIIGPPKNPDDYFDKILQILNAYMGTLTGLTGLVGFVVGYYFKGKDDDADRT